MLRTLLSGLPVIQVAVVVHDLEACAARQAASLGNAPLARVRTSARM